MEGELQYPQSSDIKGFGYFLVHCSFSMQGEVGLMLPQGPCNMLDTTIQCSSRSSAGSGISAHKMLSSILSGVILSSGTSHTKIWACGRPNSTE